MIAQVFDVNHGTYGYRRVHAVLARSGEQVWPAPVSSTMCTEITRE